MEAQASVLHVQVANADDSSVESNFGCTHYRRRCKIRAPCCDEIFDCRHCHNEIMVHSSWFWNLLIRASIQMKKECEFKYLPTFLLHSINQNSLEIDPIHRHDVPRHEVKKVICSLCDTKQDVQQNCINCGVCMENYFCPKCKFYDNDVSKNQYHCDQCGICRTGGKENFFHCDKCGCCYSKAIKDTHVCVERAMHHDCPVCSEFLFDTLKDLTMLPCGHTMHLGCLKEMEQHHRHSCPICSKSMWFVGFLEKTWSWGWSNSYARNI